jgi:hypothetical protein
METKFITKWALTDGIIESDVQHKTYEGYRCKTPSGIKVVGISHIHTTLEQAKIKAEKMRLAEIEKLKAKIVTLQFLRF